ncbi:GntR family transcriptional regulator [Paramesorhizobium deserti]|uniref:GntR family transcriptional regulator n=1 Tax=Paramesorhizobium deserti TaxID=1494590 RepID=A0A135HY46_9HYPH|nr:GntR family transcriptional regulator [Paramesorhizobium deserti]KXF78134.1 GntR family transcriptional regulator [Paramesorhizobium deserti]
MKSVDAPGIDTRLPAYLQLRDRLAARIGNGEWGLETALPSENILSAETGLSVGTVRKAMQMLVDEGLLERRRGSGTYLRTPAFNASLFRFFSVQMPEGQGTIPTSRILSRRVEKAPAPAAALFGEADAIHVDRLRGDSERVLMTEDIWLRQSSFRGFDTLPASNVGPLLYPLFLERFGVFISRAIDEVSFSTAEAVIAGRLGIDEGAPIAVIERTAYSADGRPVEWRVARGSASWFRYRSHVGPA